MLILDLDNYVDQLGTYHSVRIWHDVEIIYLYKLIKDGYDYLINIFVRLTIIAIKVKIFSVFLFMFTKHVFVYFQATQLTQIAQA